MKKILFLGCGKMGSALLKSLLQNGFNKDSFTILDPDQQKSIPEINHISKYQELPNNYQADIIFFTFKPQGSEEIIKNLSSQNIHNQNTIFISILAGKEISFFENLLGKDKKILRLMPNLPMVINEGIFSYCFNLNIKQEEVNFLINALGKNIKLDKEELMHQVTAISGSGPAYLFFFAQSMINSAQKLGLTKEQAVNLVKQTIYGSSKLLLNSKDEVSNLISSVASKGGTTEAALEILKNDGLFEDILSKAVKSAFDRSKNL